MTLQAQKAVESGGSGGHWLAVRPRLILASAFMLFLELALIRWTGSNVVHLSYFTNFVLLGSFLGIGLGFLRVGRTTAQPYYSPVVLFGLVLAVLMFPVTVDRDTEGVLYWTSLATVGPPAWVSLPVVFCAAALVLMGPAELVGRCFPELPRLEAYRYDLIGSLIGIAAFTALSFLSAPPVFWGIIAAAAYGVLLVPRPRALYLGLVTVPSLAVVGLLLAETLTAGALWSPYYKVTHRQFEQLGVPVTDIAVNGIPHQQAVPAYARLQWEAQYGLPYDRAAAKPDDVLIVGAGSGTDVAIALSKGARHVDAVEIDPKLRELGGSTHPDKPYDDPRVTTHITDGRAFLEQTDRTYDLILFALPDSLTLVSGASSLRLESYLFTEEAMRAARERLKPGGAFSMYNYYRESWLVDRLAATANAAFGHAPCVDVVSTAGQQAVITAGLTPEAQRCGENGAWAGAPAGTPPPADDDRPFLYLKDRTVPSLYLITLGLILAVSLLAVRVVAGPYRRMRPYADLFLLGVAFLLLETKSVTGFALLFGTTWVVNAIVFAGVLVAVLAAVEVTRRFRTPPLPVMYGVLFAGLVLAWLVPNAWLLSLPVPLRAVAAVTVAFLPIFAANVVFAKRFADTADATTSFGANLLGAMVGGCLEYLALVIGYQGLLIVAALLYLGALALAPRRALA